ncbi:replication protein [Paludibacterium denitrificans]|uniref:Bacteriophage lambda Replication protein O N-terminal domain-containing protein n=1 Tax=Paludibacterium denitrificans TaxID=2675226 RepID=A0A844GFK3_9NEIS|nr:replication protein [Paludibacterium denitrificans]MTD34008.1 hypothetical protein [Paludibacterium denitrificans]
MSAAEKIISLAERRAAIAPVEGKKRMQDGFTAIPNDVEDALLRSPLTHRQERVFRAILRKTLGFNKTEDCIATTQISELTGIDESPVRKCVNDLVDMGLVARGRRTKFGTFITPNLDVSSWNFKQDESSRLPSQTGQIVPNKQYDLAPHKRQLQKTVKEPNGSSSSAKPKTDKIACPHAQLIDLYHEELPTCRQVREWNDARKSLMRARWNEKLAAGKYHDLQTGLAYWRRFFAYVNQSDFLTGRSEPGNGRKVFVADLEWIIRPTNFAKIVEGKYHEEAGE